MINSIYLRMDTRDRSSWCFWRFFSEYIYIYIYILEGLSIAFTANDKRDLYRVTKFSIYLSFTVHYNYTKIGRFTPILSIRIVLLCFYLLISHFENFSTWISRLPFALNAMLDLSTTKILLTPALILEAEINSIFFFCCCKFDPSP